MSNTITDEVQKLAILITMHKGKDPLKIFKGKKLYEAEIPTAQCIIDNKHKWLKPVPDQLIPMHEDWKRFPYK